MAGATRNVTAVIIAAIVGGAVMLAAVFVSLAWLKSRQHHAAAAQVVAAPPTATAKPAQLTTSMAHLDDEPVVPTLVQLLAPASEPRSAPLSVEEVVTRALPAVVKVETRDGIGSGFFVTSSTLLTNSHVVGSETSVTLRLSDGQMKKTAEVEDVWREVDLAVLKVDVVDPAQVALPIATPDDIKIGGEVMAIGSPLGLQNTVTRGIISGMRMYIYDRITPQGMEVIQTDAAINPGNSGGPLIDRYGRVVGVNTLKRGGDAEGLGFAVKMHYARRLLGPEFALKSASERQRETAVRRYEEALGQLARYVDQVDTKWATYRPQCFTSVSAQPSPREWFVLWNGSASDSSDAPDCSRWRGYFLGWAKVTHDALEEYNLDARQAGVPVQTLRALRRKYHVDWPAWER